jgi:hypothetical protein
MRTLPSVVVVAIVVAIVVTIVAAITASTPTGVYSRTPPSTARPPAASGYIGFDRNEYPGDANLKNLHYIFSYSGYWLNNPPGARGNSWIGKRKTLQSAGFGFLVLFNGRTYAEIKAARDATKLGQSDAAAAVRAARAEGFPPMTVIFLDQEQGGRLLPEQRSYLLAWVDGVTAANFGAGVYCSGIAAKEDSGVSIVTAEDIRDHANGRKIEYWVVNDSCPPSPGCIVSKTNLSPASSGLSFADVWQYSQSPRRPDFARDCRASYDKNGNCYAPSATGSQRLYVDLDVAASSDPSHGRSTQ